MEAPNYSNNGVTNPQIMNFYDSLNTTFLNPSMILVLFVIVIVISIFMSLGGSNSNNNNIDKDTLFSSDNNSYSSSNIIVVILVGVFIILAIINGMEYFLGVNIVASASKFFTKQPEIDIDITTTKPSVVPELKLTKQVFNIPGNTYSYNDAKALCSAYGAKLANYSEIEDAYNSGAEWCNYGWSDNQMALYPTQKTTFDGLQKIKGHENDCGRPGINGGYMANPELKFGVNCYGHKPVMTPEEEDIMAIRPHYPKTMKDIMMEERVDYWKKKLNEILVSPFNYNTWSRL